MRFVTFELRGSTRAGVVRDGRVLPLDGFPDLGAFLTASDPEHASKWVTGEAIPEADVRLRAPILRPPKIIAVGLNYRDHAAEQKAEPPASPLLFAKSPTAVIGPGDAIRLPPEAPACVDPEAEMGVVISRGGYRIPRAEAMRHVFGLTIVNDVSARDLQRSEKQWFRAKSFATFAPIGPAIVTCDEADPCDLAIELRRNGETTQKSRTSQLIFDVPHLVEFISAVFALEPGDVIATGTPAGVGVFRTPPVFLKKGDVVEVALEKVGALRNRVE